jgi:hypothetical protein
MAQNVINTGPVPLPSAKAQQRRQARSSADKFTKGIALPFPWLSTKGKKWTLNRGEQSYQFEKNRVPQPIEIVLADSSDKTHKAYFKGGYVDGANRKPDCASVDGFKPYVPKEQRVSEFCGPCPMNRMGSATTVSKAGGRPGKACKDVRVLAVVLDFDLEALDIGPISLRLPFTSHAPLADYIGVLDRMPGGGFDPDQVVTRAYFDPEATHQVVKYEFVRPLTDDELDAIDEMKKDGHTERITGSTFDYLGDDPGEEVPAPIYDNALSEKVEQAAAAAAAAAQPQPKPDVPKPPPPAPTPEPNPNPSPEPPPVEEPPEEEAPTEAAAVDESSTVPISWTPISGQPGVYFSPEKGGLVTADGTAWSPPVEKKPEPFKLPDPPSPGVKRERRATAGSTPKAVTKEAPVTHASDGGQVANGADTGKVPNPPDDLMSLMNKLMDKKS